MSCPAAVRRRPWPWFGGSIIGAVLALQVLPLTLVVLFSFNGSPRLSFPLDGLSLRWYAKVLDDDRLVAALQNSLVAALVTAVACAVVGGLAAFAIQAFAPRARGVAEAVFGLPNITPPLLLGVGLAILTQMLGIRRGMPTIVAGHVIVALPFVILAMRSKVAGFDFGLIEAARDLGASPARAMLDVTLPLMRTAIASSAFLAAALSMDEFIVAQFIRGTEQTVPTFIFGQLRRGVDPSVNALATMVLCITGALAVLAQLVARREP